MKKVINTVAQTVTFTFDGCESVVFDSTKLSQANRAYAVLHGMAARIGDTAAISKSAENNFIVTEEMRRAEVLRMVAFYEDANNADWETRKAAPRAAAHNPAIAQLAAKMGKSYEEALAWFGAKLEAELAGM